MGKTAKELSTAEVAQYRPFLKMEDFGKDPAVAERREFCWMVAGAVADMLRREYGATRIAVFGSLAQKTIFTPWSDIDLAVWGVKPEQYFSAAGAAMDMGLDFGVKVDLVDAEDCSEGFQADLAVDGVTI